MKLRIPRMTPAMRDTDPTDGQTFSRFTFEPTDMSADEAVQADMIYVGLLPEDDLGMAGVVNYRWLMHPRNSKGAAIRPERR